MNLIGQLYFFFVFFCTAMMILDPNLRDGVHEWRDGKRLVKEGYKLYLEGTNTLAGRSVFFFFFPRSLSQFSTIPHQSERFLFFF
jgi:N-acetylglucosamine-6-phosphate deacetylase